MQIDNFIKIKTLKQNELTDTVWSRPTAIIVDYPDVEYDLLDTFYRTTEEDNPKKSDETNPPKSDGENVSKQMENAEQWRFEIDSKKLMSVELFLTQIYNAASKAIQAKAKAAAAKAEAAKAEAAAKAEVAAQKTDLSNTAKPSQPDAKAAVAAKILQCYDEVSITLNDPFGGDEIKNYENYDIEFFVTIDKLITHFSVLLGFENSLKGTNLRGHQLFFKTILKGFEFNEPTEKPHEEPKPFGDNSAVITLQYRVNAIIEIAKKANAIEKKGSDLIFWNEDARKILKTLTFLNLACTMVCNDGPQNNDPELVSEVDLDNEYESFVKELKGYKVERAHNRKEYPLRLEITINIFLELLKMVSQEKSGGSYLEDIESNLSKSTNTNQMTYYQGFTQILGGTLVTDNNVFGLRWRGQTELIGMILM